MKIFKKILGVSLLEALGYGITMIGISGESNSTIPNWVIGLAMLFFINAVAGIVGFVAWLLSSD